MQATIAAKGNDRVLSPLSVVVVPKLLTLLPLSLVQQKDWLLLIECFGPFREEINFLDHLQNLVHFALSLSQLAKLTLHDLEMDLIDQAFIYAKRGRKHLLPSLAFPVSRNLVKSSDAGQSVDFADL